MIKQKTNQNISLIGRDGFFFFFWSGTNLLPKSRNNEHFERCINNVLKDAELCFVCPFSMPLINKN